MRKLHLWFATLLAAVAVCSLFGAALSASPQVSEEFSAIIKVTINSKNSSEHLAGSGVWASSLKQGRNVQRFEFGQGHPLNELHLQRFDLSTAYEQISHEPCSELPLEGPMQPLWNWLSLATESITYIGNEKYRSWTLAMGYATVGLYFRNNDTDPSWFIVDGDYRRVEIEIVHWNSFTPHEVISAVPRDCPSNHTSSTQIGCVSRSTMISRAQNWVNHRVPYSQTGRYDGYRTDCSGFVSMAWEAATPGYTTSTLPQISHPISRGSLQPGDVLLCRTEHVVIFGGWSDSSHYIAYEETRPGEGTVRRVTPYPYWYNTNCFLPYRYNSVC